ncbi:hypothetical protein [Senegalia sp. (in: firmicutes)]
MKNGVLFQVFEWYLPDDGNYYEDMLAKLDDLKEMVWIEEEA